MSNQTNQAQPNHEVPDWLKVIQLNSWEAELLISALLLYMLFQVPGSLENYQQQHFPTGIFHTIISVFITALKVLRIGYMLHIIARGIWVASVGLSYVYPKSLDPEKLKLKGKFGEELEEDISLEKTIKRLEKFASLSYAISFMISGMVISVGLTFVYILIFVKWMILPAMEGDSAVLKVLSLLFIFIIAALMLIVFIDFITNGVLRREKAIAKYYYYPALVIRYLTLSFIYNRIQQSITSNLPKWQRHMVPILATMLIVGYAYGEQKIEDWQDENYFEDVGKESNRSNYENFRQPSDPLFVTIPDEVIDRPVLPVFLRSNGLIGRLYQKQDDYDMAWNKLSTAERANYVNQIFTIKIDQRSIEPDWLYTQHRQEFKGGFKSYIEMSDIEKGIHKLTVSLDTASMNPLQKRLVKENDPYFVQLADIDFYYLR